MTLPCIPACLALLAAVLAPAGFPAVAAAAVEKPVQIGFVYVTPVGEAGWSHAHDQARRALENIPGVTTFFVESVPEGADSERVILHMARKGYDAIFAASFGYMDAMLKVAGQFPEIHFLHCSGYKTAPNMTAYFGRMYQARYLSGMVAGAMTKKNMLGYVAAFPIPEVIRGINAFALGARGVNPNVQVRVVWTKTWHDPATEKNAAKSLLDVGADVIAQHQDSPGPQEAAQERGAYSVGYNSDMSRFAPEAHLVSVVWNWAPFYTDVARQLRKGEWKAGNFWFGMETGIVGLSPFGPMVPQKVRDMVDARKAAVISGEYVVFSGPVADQAGTIRIPAGKRPDDKELLTMDWFVEGVVSAAR